MKEHVRGTCLENMIRGKPYFAICPDDWEPPRSMLSVRRLNGVLNKYYLPMRGHSPCARNGEGM